MQKGKDSMAAATRRLGVFAIFLFFFLTNIVVIFLYKSNKTAYDIW